MRWVIRAVLLVPLIGATACLSATPKSVEDVAEDGPDTQADVAETQAGDCLDIVEATDIRQEGPEDGSVDDSGPLSDEDAFAGESLEVIGDAVDAEDASSDTETTVPTILSAGRFGAGAVMQGNGFSAAGSMGWLQRAFRVGQ